MLVIVSAVLFSFYAFRVAHWPGYDFDELGFLNIPYRFAEFGDFRYPAFLDAEGFGSEPIRKYPPIMAGLLRSLVHGAFGFSAWGSRIFSGVLMIGIALLSALLLRRMGVPSIGAALAAFLIGLQPSVVIAARSFRLEQEIVFLAVAALAIPLLFAGRLPRTAWALSGLAASWAAMSHPWGMFAPGSLLLAVLAFGSAWRCRDGLSWWTRLAFLALGALPSALITSYQVFHDWPRFREYVAAQSELYAIRSHQNVEWFAKNFDHTWASKHLPRYWAAKINEMGLYAAIVPGGYRWVEAFPVLLWVQLAIVGACVPIALQRRPQPADLPPLVFASATAGVMGVFLLYPPSTNYYAYPAVVIPISAILVVAWAWSHRGDGRRGTRALAIAGSLVLAVAGVITGDATLHTLQTVRTANAAVPLDRYLDAQSAMGSRLGFKSSSGAFCDMVTWIACGHEARSALQAVVLAPGPLPSGIEAASFHQPHMGALVDRFPSFTTPSLTTPEKVARLRHLTAGLKLAGLIRVPHGVDLYFTRRLAEDGALPVIELDLKGDVVSSEAREIAALGCSWPGLGAGRYLVVSPASAEPPAPVQASGGKSSAWIGGTHLERIAFVELTVSGSIDACARMAAPFRLFRLEPAAPR